MQSATRSSIRAHPPPSSIPIGLDDNNIDIADLVANSESLARSDVHVAPVGVAESETLLAQLGISQQRARATNATAMHPGSQDAAFHPPSGIDVVFFTIRSCRTDILMGAISLHIKGGNGEIGFFIKPQYRNHGIATQSVPEVLRFCFTVLRLTRVFAVTEKANVASRRVLSKIGMAEISIDPHTGRVVNLVRGISAPKLHSNMQIENGRHRVADLRELIITVRKQTIRPVLSMSMAELDFLIIPEANSIGMLLKHIAYIWTYYRLLLFEKRSFTRDELQFWSGVMPGNSRFKDHFNSPPDFYVDLLNEEQAQFLSFFNRLDDQWLDAVPDPSANLKEVKPNRYYITHALLDENSHKGQIRMISRLFSCNNANYPSVSPPVHFVPAHSSTGSPPNTATPRAHRQPPHSL